MAKQLRCAASRPISQLLLVLAFLVLSCKNDIPKNGPVFGAPMFFKPTKGPFSVRPCFPVDEQSIDHLTLFCVVEWESSFLKEGEYIAEICLDGISTENDTTGFGHSEAGRECLGFKGTESIAIVKQRINRIEKFEFFQVSCSITVKKEGGKKCDYFCYSNCYRVNQSNPKNLRGNILLTPVPTNSVKVHWIDSDRD